MVNEILDIERCVWDIDYRRKVKRMLNFRSDATKWTANQNGHAMAGRKVAAEAADSSRTT